MRTLAWLIPLILMAGTARAQVVDPDATLVEELVVTARLPGPAWWKVSDADSTVYVLGVPSVVPKGLVWDQAGMVRRLDGANRVILPFNQVGVSLAKAPAAVVGLMRLRSKRPYEESLPPVLKARFVAARTQAGQPASRYRFNNGLVTGVILAGDGREAVQLTAADPGKTIRRLAKARKLKVEEKVYDLTALVGPMLKTSEAGQMACLEEALDDVEAGPANVRRAAQAWAEGEVRAALNVERGFERCLLAAPGALAFDARFKADQADAIARALKLPGHSVAVVQLRPLLARGGVLDRLRDQGFEVETPDAE